MKRIMFWLLSFVTVVVLFLYLTTLISTAHQQARATVQQSILVKSSVGIVEHAFLTLFRQKTGPSGKGCTELTYFVIGADGAELASVLLIKDSNRSEWHVIELVIRTAPRFRASCTPG
jgi:lipopolysaccharide export LptBFGC system permease protein LptF